MMHSRRRPWVSRSLRYMLCGIFSAAMQHGAPLLSDKLAAFAQTSPKQKPAGQSRSQKVVNPLNELLEEAKRDIDKNEFEAAIAPLQKVIVEQPDSAYAHFQLAYVYTALKKTTEARAEYERTIALDPKMSEAYLDLGILLLDKEPAASVAPLTKAAELLPAQSRPHFLLGVALERSGNPGAAATAFENAVALDPMDLDTLLHLGETYLALNRATNAEQKFRNAIERQPREPRSLLGLARSLDQQKKPDAAEAYEKYLAVHPEDSVARARLVHLYLEQGKFDAADAELSRSDSGKPSLELLKLRADIQIGRKKWGWLPATRTFTAALAASICRNAIFPLPRKNFARRCISMARI